MIIQISYKKFFYPQVFRFTINTQYLPLNINKIMNMNKYFLKVAKKFMMVSHLYHLDNKLITLEAHFK